MKTVGVLGGLGPQATMQCEARVHEAAQRLIPQHVNSGYPPMCVYYFRGVPFVADAEGAPERPLRPCSAFLSAAAAVGRVADFLVIISNFLHLFETQIEAASGCEVLSMVDLALEQVAERRWQRVGVLGFGDPLVYTERLSAAGTATETITGDTRRKLDDAIVKVMEGKPDDQAVRAAEFALSELRERPVDGTILACTEIPILLSHPASDADLIDPLPLLAEATVRHALG
ncbi:MAG TPA: aspartate/glutamate racemase family protein [Candidatus Binataceae bacterium]|nr:aspartate/glutamate racemase family protein [Candidatus Binataceae bacterium]